MKNRTIVRYLVYTLIGFTTLAAGVVLGKFIRDAHGIMETLPYLLIGIGAGVFGQNLSGVIKIWTKNKASQAAKHKEIEEKDERNISIRNMAKAKAFDLMVIVFGSMITAIALLKIDRTVVIAFIITYLFVLFSSIYFTIKYNKEM